MPWCRWFLVPVACCLLFACDSGPIGPVRKHVVYFSSDRGGGGNMNIWRMDVDGKSLHQVTHYTEGDFWPADVSPDGQRLLFYRLDDYTLASAIYIMDLSGPEPVEQKALVFGLATAGNFYPDGQSFVYRKHVFTSDTASNDALFEYDFRDSSSIQISEINVHNYDPQVSPDGSKVCYTGKSNISDDARQIFVMNADGSNRQSVTPAESGHYARQCSFSPDGSQLIFPMNAQSFSYDLYRADLTTGELHPVSRWEKPDDIDYHAFPSVDTSGTRVYFRAWDGAQSGAKSEIMSINLDGSGLKRLTFDQYRDDKPVVAVIEMEQ